MFHSDVSQTAITQLAARCNPLLFIIAFRRKITASLFTAANSRTRAPFHFNRHQTFRRPSDKARPVIKY